MDLLNNLLGGGQRQQFEDFTNRYQQGAPWDGIGDDEALERYREVSRALPPDQYEDAARRSFERLTPQQRLEFGRYLQQRASAQGITDFDGDGMDDRYQDASQLAAMTARAEQRQPGLLEQLMGAAGGGGGLGGLLGGGGQTSAAQGGGMLSNPIAKAALGGIAAMAVGKLMNR